MSGSNDVSKRRTRHAIFNPYFIVCDEINLISQHCNVDSNNNTVTLYYYYYLFKNERLEYFPFK